jgi:hypothetical protein
MSRTSVISALLWNLERGRDRCATVDKRLLAPAGPSAVVR